MGDGGGGVLPVSDAHDAGTEEVALAPGPCVGWRQEEFWLVLADIHRANYGALVRLAALFLDAGGEDAVQDAFVRVSGQWDRITEADKVLLYLRRRW